MITWKPETSGKVGVTDQLYLDDQYLGMLYRFHHGTEAKYLFVGNHESPHGLGTLREYINAESLDAAKQKAVDLVIAFYQQGVEDLTQAALELSKIAIALQKGGAVEQEKYITQAKIIEGIVYRVKTVSGGFLVEVPDNGDTIGELCRLCARLTMEGHVISSVTRVFECDPSTPRVSVLRQPEYKEEIERLRKEQGEY